MHPGLPRAVHFLSATCLSIATKFSNQSLKKYLPDTYAHIHRSKEFKDLVMQKASDWEELRVEG